MYHPLFAFVLITHIIFVHWIPHCLCNETLVIYGSYIEESKIEVQGSRVQTHLYSIQISTTSYYTATFYHACNIEILWMGLETRYSIDVHILFVYCYSTKNILLHVANIIAVCKHPLPSTEVKLSNLAHKCLVYNHTFAHACSYTCRHGSGYWSKCRCIMRCRYLISIMTDQERDEIDSVTDFIRSCSDKNENLHHRSEVHDFMQCHVHRECIVCRLL